MPNLHFFLIQIFFCSAHIVSKVNKIALNKTYENKTQYSFKREIIFSKIKTFFIHTVISCIQTHQYTVKFTKKIHSFNFELISLKNIEFWILIVQPKISINCKQWTITKKHSNSNPEKNVIKVTYEIITYVIQWTSNERNRNKFSSPKWITAFDPCAVLEITEFYHRKTIIKSKYCLTDFYKNYFTHILHRFHINALGMHIFIWYIHNELKQT